MVFRVTFKTPNAFDLILEEITNTANVEMAETEVEEHKNIIENQLQDNILDIESIKDKFVKYGELITVEFNTDLNTATVVPI